MIAPKWGEQSREVLGRADRVFSRAAHQGYERIMGRMFGGWEYRYTDLQMTAAGFSGVLGYIQSSTAGGRRDTRKGAWREVNGIRRIGDGSKLKSCEDRKPQTRDLSAHLAPNRLWRSGQRIPRMKDISEFKSQFEPALRGI